jgi:hypothetical protein
MSASGEYLIPGDNDPEAWAGEPDHDPWDDTPEAADDYEQAERRADRLAKSRRAKARKEQAATNLREPLYKRIEVIDRWEADETSDLNDLIAADESWLIRYAEVCRKADPKETTFKLPSAVIDTTRGSRQMEVTDEKAAVGWAWRTERGDLVRRKDPVVPEPELDKAAAKKLLGKELRSTAPDLDTPGEFDVIEVATGEIVPGIIDRRNPLVVVIDTGGAK